MTQDRGYRRNLTNYGDRKFALYLRRSFAQATGLSRELMDKPIVGIARTDSGFNNCHRGVPSSLKRSSAACSRPAGCRSISPPFPWVRSS